jgi:DNA-binding CsgD family transcriptional regulator
VDENQGAGVMLWGEAQLECLDQALARASSGQPTAIAIAGEPGTGKTALLDELTSRAAGFAVLGADGVQSERVPFSVLAQLGVQPPSPTDDGIGDPFMAAQRLRERVDEAGKGRPLLIRVDDLHWADPESVEAITWLLRRATGDRILIAVASRPLAAHQHGNWQRWVRDHGGSLALGGLSEEQARELVEQLRPGTPGEIASKLWDHTSGNPLYLTALLGEYQSADLMHMRRLPAPAEFVAVLASRVARLPEDAAALLEGLAVLGTGWSSLPDAADVADLSDAGPAVERLLEEGLLQLRAPQGAVSIRVGHALIGAAVYQQMPMGRRRARHARAADVMTARSAVLEHRMAAAQHYDDELAEQMLAYGEELYQQQSFRLAAQHLRWSSVLTRDPALRSKRWLDSLFSSVMALDVSTVHAEREAIAAADDTARRALVLGGLAVWERRYRDGLAILEPIADDLDPQTDRVVRYRMAALTAWARMCLGRPTIQVARALDQASADRVPDGGLDGTELVTWGGTTVQMVGYGAALQDERLRGVPERPEDTPVAATKQLIWRGAARARLGLLDAAVEDLREGTRRIQNGVTDFGRGAFHAALSFAEWLRGDWGHARVAAGLGLDFSATFSHPMVLALGALPEVGEGRFDRADELLERADAILREAPWWEACQLLAVARVARAHAADSDELRAGLLGSMAGLLAQFDDLTHASPLLTMHLGLAAVWAGESGLGERCVMVLADGAADGTLPGRWVPAASRWLEGLMQEQAGKTSSALALLAEASSQDVGLPLYRAHMLIDRARVAGQAGMGAEARESRSAAQQLYLRLGAQPYLQRRHDAPVEERAAVRPSAVFALTEREHDVLTLVASGMSYAQVSRELFITQSTVGYHLSNIYAKVGVRSRHELTAMYRRSPELFGLAVSA